jgi:hypothetical protein
MKNVYFQLCGARSMVGALEAELARIAGILVNDVAVDDGVVDEVASATSVRWSSFRNPIWAQMRQDWDELIHQLVIAHLRSL